MARQRIWRALGLMSGTSADGTDAALLETDGECLMRPGAALSRPYKPELSALLRAAMAKARGWAKGTPMPFRLGDVELLLTEAHAAAVRELLDEAKLQPRAAVRVPMSRSSRGMERLWQAPWSVTTGIAARSITSRSIPRFAVKVSVPRS